MFDKNTVIEKNKGGRPTKATEELKAEFCQLILEGTRVRKACEKIGVDKTTIMRWLKQDSEFRTHYTHARELYVDFFIDEIVEDCENVAEDKEAIARQRLISDIKLRVLEKVLPKKYGQHIRHDHTFELMSERIKRIRQEEDRRLSGRDQAKSLENQGKNGSHSPPNLRIIHDPKKDE